MATQNDTALARYTVQYDLSGITDPTVFPIQASPGTTYRLLREGAPKFYLKVDEGKTTNWQELSANVTGINLGTGAQVLKNVVGTQLQFRTLKGGSGVSVLQTANEIQISFSGSSTINDLNCTPAVSILDLVVFSGGTLNPVTDNSDLTIPYGIVGVVYSKSAINKADILLAGRVDGLFGLTPGSPVFVGPTGNFQSGAPITGNVQLLGFAIDTTSIVFEPKLVVRRA
jgi:hypothetical protein